jgi:hypothetical protein
MLLAYITLIASYTQIFPHLRLITYKEDLNFSHWWVSTLQHTNPFKTALSGILPALTAIFGWQQPSAVAALSLDLFWMYTNQQTAFSVQRKTIEKHKAAIYRWQDEILSQYKCKLQNIWVVVQFLNRADKHVSKTASLDNMLTSIWELLYLHKG